MNLLNHKPDDNILLNDTTKYTHINYIEYSRTFYSSPPITLLIQNTLPR